MARRESFSITVVATVEGSVRIFSRRGLLHVAPILTDGKAARHAQGWKTFVYKKSFR